MWSLGNNVESYMGGPDSGRFGKSARGFVTTEKRPTSGGVTRRKLKTEGGSVGDPLTMKKPTGR